VPRQTGQYSWALASYQEALERQVIQPEEVHLNRVVIFSDCLRKYEAADRELAQAPKTASAWQVGPLYQHSSGRARNYQRQLSALRDYLNRPQ
jgi:hypothetical protein